MDEVEAALGIRVEDASLRAWPGIETATIDGWELRSAGGFTKRANSVQPVGPSTRSLSENVRECEEWYESRGLPVIMRLTPFSDVGLDAVLDERKYEIVEPTDVLSVPLTKQPESDAGAELQELETEDWVQKYLEMSGRPRTAAPFLSGILRACGQQRILGALADGEQRSQVACGLAVLDHDLVGLFDLVTAEPLRRRGYGAALVQALVAWGAARGAHHAYLQVAKTNEPARQLYQKLGFETLYTYWYRVRRA